MDPFKRKAESENILQKLNIPICEHLPIIVDDEDKVHLRTKKELLERLISLWAIVGTQIMNPTDHFKNYIVSNKFETFLSEDEKKFIFSKARSKKDFIKFSWRIECMYFLAWCGCLIESLEIPKTPSSVDSILHLFPKKLEKPTVLEESIKLRDKNEVLHWADLIYRLDWVVSEVDSQGKLETLNFEGGVIREWHHAVNWFICEADENNWDAVPTDT